MAIDKDITEIPDSDDEPLTSSPAAISDQTDKLHPARRDAPQASQDVSQDVACEAQALVKETTQAASKQKQSLVVSLETRGENNETFKTKSSANAQLNDNNQRLDTTPNTATADTRGPLSMTSSKIESSEKKASTQQSSASSQLALQLKSQPDQEKHTLEDFVEPETMQNAPKVDRAILPPTIGESDAAKPGLAMSESIAIAKRAGAPFSKHDDPIHKASDAKVPSSELADTGQPEKPNSEAAATRVGFQISSPTTNQDAMKESSDVSHHETRLEQIPYEMPDKSPDGIVASDITDKNTDSNTPIAVSSLGAPSKAGYIKHGDHIEDTTEFSKFTPASKPHIPAKSRQEVTLAELKAQRTALLASLAALPNVQELISQNCGPTESPKAFESESTDAETMAAANKIVKRHIKLLHEYNEIKDVGEGLMGLIADQRGVRIVEVQDDFGVGRKD